jgi:hypothetical protein
LLIKKVRVGGTNDGLPEISKMKYRIPEPGTTFGFADSKKKKKKIDM